MFRSSSNRAAPKKEEKLEFDSPMEELNYLLDSLDERINQSMDEYIESIRPPPPEPKQKRSGGVLDSWKMLRKSKVEGDTGPKGIPAPPSSAPALLEVTPNRQATKSSRPPSAPSSGASVRSFNFIREEKARFVTMDAERAQEIVEFIRRVAELVVISERSCTSDAPIANDHTAIFETFFERNGLATITNILSGACFDLKTHPSVLKQLENELSPESAVTPSGDEESKEDPTYDRPINLDEHNYHLLPPLSIATQAIQSVSILVQNVSRATSLFFILSNNHVNQLINFPLEKYHIAERLKHNQEGNGMSPRRFGSPELAELTTHFVTFLKSLAMRMNAETLQFFLTYPDSDADDIDDIVEIDDIEHGPNDPNDPEEERPMDEMHHAPRTVQPETPKPVTVKTVKVEFPLYERALEFCSAHQDSFVRVTAMNICLNTLRLATVSPADDGTDGESDKELGKSPDGVLHNAKPLPLKERLAIAQYVCTPSRVELLASPLFTKLAQLWGILEEQFREMDALPSSSGMDGNTGDKRATPSSMSKVAKAKIAARRQKSRGAFNDTADSIQDELLLLEDVLKVGLTSLNEQTIEMMFATFVYPLLLQPLLLYFQRSPVPDEILFADILNNHSAGREIGASDRSAAERAIISAPAKSALFCLAAVFQLLTNPPLLRLLFTALFHPLSPQATGETMIRAKADVACMGADGKVKIRIDPIGANGRMKTVNDRSSYIFGTLTGRKCVSGRTETRKSSEDSCVFVLAPALCEILEFRGNDGALVARTRHNPYRKAIFQCFTLSSELSDLRPLSVAAVESAVSVLEAKLLADILFGVDLKKFQDNMPIDERTSDSVMAHIDDRDIGGGTMARESRLSLGAPVGGKVGFNHMNEVLSSFRTCIMKAVPAGQGTWRLEYDPVAAHALLCVVRGDVRAVSDAARGIDRRCRQAAALLSDLPKDVEKYSKSKLVQALKSTENKGPSKGATTQGAIVDFLFRGRSSASSEPSVLAELFEFKGVHRAEDSPGYSAPVSTVSSFQELCNRSCSFPGGDGTIAESVLNNAKCSARAWVNLDAFSTLLNTLVATDSVTIRDKQRIGGFAVKRDGTLVSTPDQGTVYSQLSKHLLAAIFEFDPDSSYAHVESGSVVSLIGHQAFPCVCEVPPSSAPLFSEAGAKVVSQGVTWQSLYLVNLGHQFVLAEPERRTSGDGRVVTRCMLERLKVGKDAADARADTTARRLIVSHDGPEPTPPGLFLFDKAPVVQDNIPFSKVKQLRSSLDIWFEDNKSVGIAFEAVERQIEEAKAFRGLHLQRYLAQGDGSGYPLNIPLYKTAGSS